MARAFVLLLVLPTMLMPPGMCICRLFPVGRAPTPLAHEQRSVASHAAGHRPDCACEPCRSRAVLSDQGDDRPAQPPSRGPSQPADHWPGCPAAVGAVPLNMVVPTATVTADLVATAAFFTHVVESAGSPARVATTPSPATSPPLFISHCTLLI